MIASDFKLNLHTGKYSYNELAEEFRSYETEYLYQLLDNDSSLMFLGGGDDEYYQAFDYAAFTKK